MLVVLFKCGVTQYTVLISAFFFTIKYVNTGSRTCTCTLPLVHHYIWILICSWEFTLCIRASGFMWDRTTPPGAYMYDTNLQMSPCPELLINSWAYLQPQLPKLVSLTETRNTKVAKCSQSDHSKIKTPSK